MYYLNYFFIFSIIGHFLETIIYVINDWSLESGFLYGYWTPVYGIGVVLIIYIHKLIFNKLKINKFYKILLFILIITIILTITEYIGGNILELIFNRTFWDYSDHKYHFGKYIALDVSCLWAVLSIGFLYLVKPWMDKIILKIPKFITYILCILFIIDLVCTLIFKSKI